MRVQILELTFGDGRKVSVVSPVLVESAEDPPLRIEGIRAFPPFEDESMRQVVFDQAAPRQSKDSDG